MFGLGPHSQSQHDSGCHHLLPGLFWLFLSPLCFHSSSRNTTIANMGSIEPPVSVFQNTAYIPPDAIFEVTRDFLTDLNPKKVNLGQGTYRDENGKPWVLPAVQMAKEAVASCGHEYLPILGLKTFQDGAVKLIFHETKALFEGRVWIIRIHRKLLSC